MSYRPQTSSRRNTGRARGRAHHEKAKRKEQKHHSGGRYLLEEEHIITSEEIAAKTVNRLHSLGNQIFAFSPFSDYFDDWLMTLQEVLSEFESSPAISVDEAFVKERTQTLTDVERELAQRRLEESELERTAKSLADNNHLLVQIDTEYASRTSELASKRDSEIRRLTRVTRDFEEELDSIDQMKTGIFGLFAKRAKAQKRAEVTQKLNAAKTELELVMQNFTVEQEKLHDDYEKRKQAIIEQVQNLEKELEKTETDSSPEPRRIACEALVNAVDALLQRSPPQPQ
jgi:hypothetical protein